MSVETDDPTYHIEIEIENFNEYKKQCIVDHMEKTYKTSFPNYDIAFIKTSEEGRAIFLLDDLRPNDSSFDDIAYLDKCLFDFIKDIDEDGERKRLEKEKEKEIEKNKIEELKIWHDKEMDRVSKELGKEFFDRGFTLEDIKKRTSDFSHYSSVVQGYKDAENDRS